MIEQNHTVMFGWRARIGYLCPSVFEMIAHDFYRVVPPGVAMIGVTCMIEGWTNDAYRAGLNRVEECAEELGRRNCDFIIHSGVPLVVSQGVGFEKEIIKKISAIAQSPATTSIQAAIEALQALSIYRVGVVNPYPPELNRVLEAFLSQTGFKVSSMISLGADFVRIGDITPADVFCAAKQALREAGRLDGLYLPCPQFPTLDVVEEIETDLAIPVIPHLGSEVWAALRAVGIRKTVSGFGRLLRSL
jgi:maleate isomerase